MENGWLDGRYLQREQKKNQTQVHEHKNVLSA